MTNLELFNFNKDAGAKVVNVASVPQRSPFRYPGGKTWLIPVIRKWLKKNGQEGITLVDAFAGGGIVGLTAAFENLAENIVMIERDEEIAAAWKAILGPKNQWLADKILSFDLTIENAKKELDKAQKPMEESAFCTILKNRIFHGGIIAKGSGLIKHGENGKGIASRWYPKTLYRRIIAINSIAKKVKFIEGDSFEFLKENSKKGGYCFFIDPPYIVAGKRLYTYYDIDHPKLFKICSGLEGDFLMTYDDTDEIRALAGDFGFLYKSIPMKTTHHIQKYELLISKNLDWLTL